MINYVIRLSSDDKDFYLKNDYGYYAGKMYIVNRMSYPYTDSKITDRTKRYKSEKVALSAAQRIYDKCLYVLAYEVIEEEVLP